MNAPLDEFDLRLLNVLQGNNRLPVEELAEIVCLSASAVQRRIRRLRDTGVIEADISVISPEAVGRTVTAVVNVTLEHEHPAILHAFRDLMIETPQVMQCYYVTGHADFMLIMTATDLQDYADLATRLFGQNPNVRRFETSFVVGRVKRGLTVPLAIR